MTKVYVTQETSHDFRRAEEFGDLVFLSDGRDDFHNIKNSGHNDRLIAHLRQGLRDFQKDDYLVLIGSPYVQAAVMTMLGHLGFHAIKLLRWDNRDYTYIPLELSF